MYSDIQHFVYEASDHYLQPEEITGFKDSLDTLSQRLEIYELLRDREIVIFQAVADRLQNAFPQEPDERLEQALKHWLAVMRYCAMAMLLNQPEFLERRLLEWLTDMVQAHQLEAVEAQLYKFLQTRLGEELSSKQMTVFQPFIEQAESTLLGAGIQNAQVAVAR